MDAKRGVYSTRTQILEGWGDVVVKLVDGRTLKSPHVDLQSDHARQISSDTTLHAHARRTTPSQASGSRRRHAGQAHDVQRCLVPLSAQLYRQVVGDAPGAMTRRCAVRGLLCWSRRSRASARRSSRRHARRQDRRSCNFKQRPPGSATAARSRAGRVLGGGVMINCPARNITLHSDSAERIRTTTQLVGHAAV